VCSRPPVEVQIRNSIRVFSLFSTRGPLQSSSTDTPCLFSGLVKALGMRLPKSINTHRSAAEIGDAGLPELKSSPVAFITYTNGLFPEGRQLLLNSACQRFPVAFGSTQKHCRFHFSPVRHTFTPSFARCVLISFPPQLWFFSI